jgi:tripartite-type tricarboxylate transporter receptor subunit TctC
MARLFTAVAAAEIAGSVAFANASAQPVSFEGKTVHFIINSKAGGGTDAAARLAGNTMAKFLPGAPQIIFRNIPGGGGLQANNYFMNQVKPDGMTALAGSRTQISPAKLRAPAVKYDPSKYEFIGGDANLGTVMMIRPEALPRLTDASAPPIVYGDIDGTRSGLLVSVWAKEYLGWNLRWVVGYSGTSAMLMALQSGEIDMTANQNAFRIMPMLKSGKVAGVAQLGVRNEAGDIERRDELGDVPLLEELLMPKLGGKAKDAFMNMQADFLVNKWFALPPKTPPAYVAAWRAAYAQAIKDPQYLKVASTELGDDFQPLSGQRLAEIVAQLTATTDEDLEFVAALRKKHDLPQ